MSERIHKPSPAPTRKPVTSARGVLRIHQQSSAASTSAENPEAIREAARHGTSGVGGPLPHLATIQRAFGAFPLASIRGHTDPMAAQAARSMGAVAFAYGEHVAFSHPPDIRTAAHEAAHVVQQRFGVQLKDGVGRAGDRYEQHADTVAELVAQGQFAAKLLDRYPATRGALDARLQGPDSGRTPHGEREKAGA